MTPAAPYLSLVTPVYNGEAYIRESVADILRVLEKFGRPFEVIVVSDGSQDRTAERVWEIEDPRVRLLHYPENRGKGNAVLHGTAEARGRVIAWLDSDLDISPEMVVTAARHLQDGQLDAVIGSKRHPESRVEYPMIRRFYSFGFQLLVRALFRVNVRDTQVGAKVFRRELLETVVPLLLVKRYAFDLEVLAVAAEFGFDRIAEAPIELRYRFTGSGINHSSVRRMFLDTLAIAYRIHVRHWYVRQFASQQRTRVDITHPASEPFARKRPPVPIDS
jgi:glycosyltransferase involved in cell wall biosynthesis